MEDKDISSKIKFQNNWNKLKLWLVGNFYFPIKIQIMAKFMKRLAYYLAIWFKMSRNSFLVIFSRKSVLFVFLAGKIIRFVFQVLLIFFLVNGSKTLAGYDSNQTLFFFLTFVAIDSTSQFLFREVYRFRNYVVTGDFDLILVKPFNSLFRILLGGADAVDLITLPFFYLSLFYVGSLLSPSSLDVLLFILLIVVGLLISTAFHIFVISFGIITLEVDHVSMIYRDVTNMGRFPVDIYKEPVKSFLTFFIPVAIMVTLPAKALMGRVSFILVIISLIISALFLFISLKFWNFALKKYTSASS